MLAPSRRLALVLPLALSLFASAATADYAFSVYTGTWTVLPNFDALTPVATGTSPVIDLSVTTRTDNFGIQFTGTLTVPVAATYSFSTTSNEGSDLRVDSTTVVNNDGIHSSTTVSGSIALSAGSHSLRVRYFERTGSQTLSVAYVPPGGTSRPLPANGALEGPPNPQTIGSWGPVIAWPHIPISIANLPDGRLLTWSSTETNAFPSSSEFTHAAIYNPSTGTFTTTDNGFHDMFCAGVSTLEDGRIVAAGGNPYDTRVSAFNPSTLNWGALANLKENRWYGTLLALPSNDLFATFANAAGDVSERYNPTSNAWVRTPGAAMTDLLNEQNAENGQTAVNQSSGLEWWGQMAVAPDGRILHGGPTQTWHLFDPRNSGGAQSLGQPAGTRSRMWGNAVTYDVGKVLIVGGADRTVNPATTAAAYKIDLNGPSPVIQSASPMAFTRAFHNTVTLPTGELIVIGGNTSGTQFTDANAVLAAEIWNPTTDAWRTVASMSMARGYHSTALLLQDGRVISAGGGACGDGCAANHLDAQIYSPPYLFTAGGGAAPRPAITASPSVGGVGDAINVTATGTIAKFSMVRLSATTHAMNTDQRYLPVPFTANGGGSYTLQLHANGNVLIPGYYWIFAVDTAGVPSIGRTFHVVLAPPPPPPPPGIEAEGESATLSGDFSVQSDAAARNGFFISTVTEPEVNTGPTSTSRAVLAFNVPTTGPYRIDANVFAIDDNHNSFYLTVDGQPAGAYLWDIPFGPAYQLDSVNNRNGADPVIVTLSAGAHTVEVIHRETGARLDWMKLVYVGTPPPVDTDGDGVPDAQDAFPNDPTEWADTDGDGHGDNSDAFPSDPTKWLPEHGVTPIAAPHSSTTLIVEGSSGADRIWNVNPDNHSVTVTSAAGAVVGEVQVGTRPWALAKAPLANEVFVANKGSASISVISTSTLAVLRTISLPAASQPHGIAFAPAGDVFYVALEGLARVEKRVPASGALLGTATVSGKPRHLAVSSGGASLYVTNFVTPPLPNESDEIDVSGGGGQLFVVATGAMTLSSTIGFGTSTRPPAEVSGPGIPNYLNAPVLFGSKAYVPSKQDNIQAGSYRGFPGMTFDQTVRAVTSVVDLPSGVEQTGQRIDHDNAGVATGAAISGEGRTLFVALETSREVAVFDTQQGIQLARLPVGRAPQGVAFSSNGRTLYVHNFMDRTLSRYDVTNMVALHTTSATLLGTTPLIAAETLPANVLLGKKLFYDAADDRLARDNYMSCASCHNDGGGDGRVWDLTAFGEGLRNTADLRGKSGMGNGPLHWTGNFDEVQDFEGQIRSLASGTGLMTNAAFNTGTRSQPLGDPKAGISADLDALAAYVASLTTAPASPVRAGGAFSATAQQGAILFHDRSCGACHSGSKFTDSALDVRHDVGTIHSGSGERLHGPLDGFDTPSVVGVWATAPYLHDGSAPTLPAAIAAHAGDPTTPAERAEIAAFLTELDPGDAQPLPEPSAGLAALAALPLLALLRRRRVLSS